MFVWTLERTLRRLGRKANPSAEFVSLLEGRLRAQTGGIRSGIPYWKIAATSLATIVTSLAGTGMYAYASDAVLPDHPLYGVRQQIETVETRIAVSEKQKAAIEVKHLRRRIHEQELMNKRAAAVSSEHVKNVIWGMDGALGHVEEKVEEKEREGMERTLLEVEQRYAETLRAAPVVASTTEEVEHVKASVQQRIEHLKAKIEKKQDMRSAEHEEKQEKKMKKELKPRGREDGQTKSKER